MYEERKGFSWINFLIKSIIAVIIILFVVWLLSLSNKSLFNSLSDSLKSVDVIADNITNYNINRMKQVGKDYFTTARLPKKTGDVVKITLKELYEKELILAVNDKQGAACSAENSYISMERLETEYKMTVHLECGEDKDQVVVYMGCYDTCIDCSNNNKNTTKQVQYQYNKNTGGKWSNYGSWSEWSKTVVTTTDERQVETKKVNETYYEPVISSTTVTATPSCPKGYDFNGTTCVAKTTSSLTCPNKEGYTSVRNGLTCTYTKTATPTCPEKSGYKVTRNGLTCTYTKTTAQTTEKYVETRNDDHMPDDTSTYHYEYVTMNYQYACNNVCEVVSLYTFDVYKKVTTYTTDKKTGEATCPSGYTKSNDSCVATTTGSAICEKGTLTNGSCVVTNTATPTCDKDYILSGNKCIKEGTVTSYKEKTRTVTYYRFRTRTYTSGTVSYKWSSSKNDTKLIKDGYKLTGKTRTVTI